MHYPKSLSKIVSKSKVRPELSMIRVSGGKMQATDSFKAFERDVDVDWDCLINPADLKAKDTFGGDEYDSAAVTRAGRVVPIPTEAPDKYPNLSTVLSDKLGLDKKATITIDVKLLADLVSAFSEQKVTLSIVGDAMPCITIEGENERGVLMGILGR